MTLCLIGIIILLYISIFLCNVHRDAENEIIDRLQKYIENLEKRIKELEEYINE